MTQIDINAALFTQLKEDYNSHKEYKHYQSQLQSGFDYMEAMIKFFGALSISVVKSMDDALYKDVFTKNFKLSPSLGDFKSLATTPFSKNSKKSINTLDKNEIYTFLDILFTEKISLELTDTTLMLEGETKTIKIKSTIQLFNEYAVGFRNKLKGHGASFRDEDALQRDLILESLDKLLTHLESNYNSIVKTISFGVDSNDEIVMSYNSVECTLLPILLYIECDKFSCSENHKTKLFFYNDGKETKSHYIDYSYNHFHQITQTNEIHKNLKALQEEVLHSSSDTQRQSLLLSDFVGRVEELKNTKDHILNAMRDERSSFISVMGKPGIGKSAFLTQLQENLEDDEELNEQLNSYTFYAQKDKMGGTTEEEKYVWKKLSAYFDKHGVSIKQDASDTFSLRDNLEKLFVAYEEKKESKPLLLIIDGLDEFAKPSDMIKNIPLNFTSKIHLIYSSRPYKNIKNAITSTLSTSDHLDVFESEKTLKEGYSLELGKLLIGEVEELLSRVLSKEILRESEEYKEIVAAIAEQSESLPLYIYYITQELKEKDVVDTANITQEIKEWAKKLPPKLSDYYKEQFASVSSLSRNILLMLFLSKSSVSKEDFYTVLQSVKTEEFKTEDGKVVDEVAFIENNFNNIEVFLNIDSDDKYSFYHLSVKEQLISYLKELNQVFTFNQDKLKEVMYESIVEHYSEYIDGMFYFKKNSDIYKLLMSLTKKVNSEDTPSYYKDNYLYLLNTFTWANIHISQINHEDMRNEKYENILEVQKLKVENKKEIENFYKLFQDKKDKHLYEIRYAYELAFIAKDYSQVLVYKDMYEEFVQDIFLEIALNIDKPEYIEKFIKHKDDWLNSLRYAFKRFCIHIMELSNKVDDSFYEVLLFLNENEKSLLCSKISMQKSLELVMSIKDEHYVEKSLITIIFENLKYSNVSQSLEFLNQYPEYGKDNILKYVIHKCLQENMFEEAYIMIDEINDSKLNEQLYRSVFRKEQKYEDLISFSDIENIIISRSNLENVISFIDTLYDRIQLESIFNKINEKKISVPKKIKAFSHIIKRVSNIDFKKKIILAINNLETDIAKYFYYNWMSHKISIQETLNLVYGMNNNTFKLNVYMDLILKIDDVAILEHVVSDLIKVKEEGIEEIMFSIWNNIILRIILQTDDTNVLKKVFVLSPTPETLIYILHKGISTNSLLSFVEIIIEKMEMKKEALVLLFILLNYANISNNELLYNNIVLMLKRFFETKTLGKDTHIILDRLIFYPSEYINKDNIRRSYYFRVLALNIINIVNYDLEKGLSLLDENKDQSVLQYVIYELLKQKTLEETLVVIDEIEYKRIDFILPLIVEKMNDTESLKVGLKFVDLYIEKSRLFNVNETRIACFLEQVLLKFKSKNHLKIILHSAVKSITSYKELEKIILILFPKIDDSQVVFIALEQIENKQLYLDIVFTVIDYIAQKDIKQASEIIFNLKEEYKQERISKIIFINDEYLQSTKIGNLITKQLYYSKIKNSSTIFHFPLKAKKEILQYFNVGVDEVTLESILDKLREINSRNEFSEVKKQISENTELLQEFIVKYGKFLNINNLDEFEVYFNDRSLSQIVV